MKTNSLWIGLLFLLISATCSWAVDPTILVYKGSSKFSGLDTMGPPQYYIKGTNKVYLIMALDLDAVGNPVMKAEVIEYWVENGVNVGVMHVLNNVEVTNNDSMVVFYSGDLNNSDTHRESSYLSGMFKYLKFKPDGISRPIPGSLNGYWINLDIEFVSSALLKFSFDSKRTKAANINIDESTYFNEAFDDTVNSILNDLDISLNP